MKNSKAQIERSLKPNLRKNVVNILLSINSEITTKIDKIELLYLNSSSHYYKLTLFYRLKF